MIEDLIHAVRQLSRHRCHAGVVVLILSLGFGANTAVFSVVDAVLLRSLPVEDPAGLVLFQWTSGPRPTVGYLSGEWWQEVTTGRVTASSFSYPAFKAFADPSATLAATIGWAEMRSMSLTVDGESDLVTAQLVSGGYYSGLGVPPILGRTTTPEDDHQGGDVAAVISHGYWQRRFGGAADVIGKRAMLDGRALTVVGVSARGFYGTLALGRSADVSVPLRAWREPREPYLESPTWYWLHVMGRLRPGVTSAQAQAEMGPRLASALGGGGGDKPGLRLTDGRQGLTRLRHEQRPGLLMLAGVTGVVLLMACVTAAGLLLARGAARRREIAVRLALGAARRRIVRQLLTESALLAGLASAVGVAFAFWTKNALAASLMRDAPLVSLDARVLGYLGAATAVITVLCGLVPALRATRLDLTRDLGSGARSLERLSLGRTLVAAQVALSLILLVGAGLLTRTLRNLTAVESGFATSGVYLFKVHANERGKAVSQRLLERFKSLPGAHAVGVSAHQLLGDTDRTRLRIEGPGSAARGR
jgi:predicted permease